MGFVQFLEERLIYSADRRVERALQIFLNASKVGRIKTDSS